MAHILVLCEARKVWKDAFIQDLTERRYPYEMMDGGLGSIQPQVREVQLLDIVVPETSIPYVMADLSPFVDLNSPSKRMAWLAGKLIRTIGRLKPIYSIPRTKYSKIKFIGPLINYIYVFWKKIEPEKYKPTEEVRARWVNIMPLGWFADKKDPNSTNRLLPKGGEWI